ncbi:ATP-grasp domain-containing protein [Nocardia arizonensis]|uniref:ATP-grasp domain-containing protein n=1 Tax=Nocardia arizonensis TaxID=1141647 RepID=UPI0009E6FB72|nr:ATP-grasp domain-containing protein [Nocardia arizonensis]
MGHLLMVESWVGSMSTLLPRGIHDRGHTFTFLTRDLGHYLRAVPDPAHPLLSAANIVSADSNDESAVASYARDLHRVLRFDGVLSSCDYYLPTVASIAAELGLPGPRRDAVAAACDKAKTRELCSAAGVPGPHYAVAARWADIAAAAEEIGYPVVVKPIDLCGGMFVRRVEDVDQLRAAVDAIAGFPVNARGQARAPQVLVEQCLVGEEFSVETVTVGGRTTIVGITDKRVVGDGCYIEAGHMFPAALAPALAESIGGLAVSAIQALGLDGTVAHTEVKLTAEGPRLIEVNPRPAGNRITELVRRVTGIDLAAAHADLAAGVEPDLAQRDTGIGSAAIAFLVPDRTGELEEIVGAQRWSETEHIVEHTLAAPGKTVRAANSNNEYLGHVMVVDEKPGTAGAIAADLIEELRVSFRDDSERA